MDFFSILIDQPVLKTHSNQREAKVNAQHVPPEV